MSWHDPQEIEEYERNAPRPDDHAAVRAEGRRLLAETTKGPWHQMAAAAWSGTNEDPNLVADCPLYADAIAIVWLRNHADALLADPAPVGLTEKELRLVSDARELAPPNPDYPIPWDRYLLARLVAIIDRLSTAPVDDRAKQPPWDTETDVLAGAMAEIVRLTDARKLTDDEARLVEALRGTEMTASGDVARLLAIIDRLSATPRAEREALERIARQGRRKPSDTGLNAVDLAMIARDALAALPAPVPEGVPEDHRVCSHGIYHHGCPSCDRQDPEERL